MSRFFMVLALAAALSAGLSACNTMDGFGRDMKAAGDALSGSASNAKGY